MTREEYYSILADKWAKVDKTNFEEIKAYNAYRRALRTLIESCEDRESTVSPSTGK